MNGKCNQETLQKNWTLFLFYKICWFRLLSKIVWIANQSKIRKPHSYTYCPNDTSEKESFSKYILYSWNARNCVYIDHSIPVVVFTYLIIRVGV